MALKLRNLKKIFFQNSPITKVIRPQSFFTINKNPLKSTYSIPPPRYYSGLYYFWIMPKTTLCFSSLLFLFLLPAFQAGGQRIAQSKEFNIRNDYFYNIFHFENGRTALFRENGDEYSAEIFDRDLTHLRTQGVTFETRKINIVASVQMDSTLKLLYTGREEGNYFLRMRKYDSGFILKDSVVNLLTESSRTINGSYRNVSSSDESRTLLFGRRGQELGLIVTDNIGDSILYQTAVQFGDLDQRDDFRQVLVTNDGVIYFLFEKDNSRGSMERHRLYVYRITEQESVESFVDLTNTVNTGVRMAYDEVNKQLVIAGTYALKTTDDLDGYFTTIVGADDIPLTAFNRFSEQLSADLFGVTSKKKSTIRDFYVVDLILRADGGCVLLLESVREFIRRSTYSPLGRFEAGTYSQRGFIDYYHEDIIVVSTRPSGEEDWYRVLYKKQFSQDDDGVYSSFFTMTTPSRVHVLYNDEIKKNSTVSEYLISPSGKYERNAILNTEYQNLQLRFKDAVQIGSNELLVPSENNYRLVLVKVRV